VIDAVGLLDDRGVQLAAVGQQSELPPLVGLAFEHKLQRPAGGLDEGYACELNRVLRPNGRGGGEDPADTQTLVAFGERPHRLDGSAQPLSQEREDGVWFYIGRAAQQAGFIGRLTGPGPQRG
jgi:hypothetical protein